jgi:hypothetical protein
MVEQRGQIGFSERGAADQADELGVVVQVGELGVDAHVHAQEIFLVQIRTEDAEAADQVIHVGTDRLANEVPGGRLGGLDLAVPEQKRRLFQLLGKGAAEFAAARQSEEGMRGPDRGDGFGPAVGVEACGEEATVDSMRAALKHVAQGGQVDLLAAEVVLVRALLPSLLGDFGALKPFSAKRRMASMRRVRVSVVSGAEAPWGSTSINQLTTRSIS